MIYKSIVAWRRRWPFASPYLLNLRWTLPPLIAAEVEGFLVKAAIRSSNDKLRLSSWPHGSKTDVNTSCLREEVCFLLRYLSLLLIVAQEREQAGCGKRDAWAGQYHAEERNRLMRWGAWTMRLLDTLQVNARSAPEWIYAMEKLYNVARVRVASNEIAIVGRTCGFSVDEAEKWLKGGGVLVEDLHVTQRTDNMELLEELWRRADNKDFDGFLSWAEDFVSGNAGQMSDWYDDDWLKTDDELNYFEAKDRKIEGAGVPEAWTKHVNCLQHFVSAVKDRRPDDRLWELVQELESSMIQTRVEQIARLQREIAAD